MATLDHGGYWFRAKRYGYGWGFPVTWQGWLVMAVFLMVLLGAGKLLMPQHAGAFLAVALLASTGLIAVCYAKGEPTRWRWGD